MNNKEYLQFQKFNTHEQAADLVDMLSRNGITCVLDEVPGMAYVLSSNPEKEYHIKLLSADFEKANSLLLAQSARQIELVDKNYYLNRFTDDELMEIICKPDEWNEFDFLCAQKILKERGKEITPAKLTQLQNERLNYLAKPETVSMRWIVLGYAIGLLGGAIAIFSGWHLLRHKKTLPNGKQVPSYSQASRRHGMIMMITGTLCLISWVVYQIITKLQ